MARKKKDFFDDMIDDMMKPVKTSKTAPKQKDPYDAIFDAMAGTPKSKNRKGDDLDGISNIYYGMKNAYKMTKSMHQQTKKVPTAPDEILRRAKSIKMKERKDKQVRKARNSIIEHNDKKERNKMYSKHGYVEGTRKLKEKQNAAASKTSKLTALRRLFNR